MTGFNVNCKDCDYCVLHHIDWNDEDNPKPEYRCFISGEIVDTFNNIVCINYVYCRIKRG